ncbi:Boron transporter 1 [Purpureocillium lavendulum]|uniref:Boron transporter 1 n=1 Tax=Purpureocillium lavendulum TaxID=1247861 RepID=A0AB34FYG8_9HYPO|nr:Boron transporter 1 [Purpureocillium lavendulum]
MHSSRVLVFLTQAVALAAAAPPTVKWTIHKTCYADTDLRDAILVAMDVAKTRAKEVADKILDTKNDKVQKAVKLLLGSDNLNDRATKVRDKMALYAGLEGPIGAPSDKKQVAGAIFRDSDEWEKLAKDNDKHYLNFVIYCAPDLVELQDTWNNRYWQDLGRERPLVFASALRDMKLEADSGQWRNPKSKVLGITETDRPGDRDKDGTPKGDLKKIAETITLHPLWLRDMKDHAYDLLTAEKLNDIKKPSAWSKFMQHGKSEGPAARPIDGLMGLEGTIHHETFHLTSFGKLKDTPEGAEAYDWVNNQKNKNIENPDLLALLALIVDLVENKSCKINERGEVTPPS